MKSDERKKQKRRIANWAQAVVLRFEEAERAGNLILWHDQRRDLQELRRLASLSPSFKDSDAHIVRLAKVIDELHARYPHIPLPALEKNPSSIDKNGMPDHSPRQMQDQRGQAITVIAAAVLKMGEAIETAHAAYWAACDAEERAIDPADLDAPEVLLDEAYEAALQVASLAAERSISWAEARNGLTSFAP